MTEPTAGSRTCTSQPTSQRPSMRPTLSSSRSTRQRRRLVTAYVYGRVRTLVLTRRIADRYLRPARLPTSPTSNRQRGPSPRFRQATRSSSRRALYHVAPPTACAPFSTRWLPTSISTSFPIRSSLQRVPPLTTCIARTASLLARSRIRGQRPPLTPWHPSTHGCHASVSSRSTSGPPSWPSLPPTACSRSASRASTRLARSAKPLARTSKSWLSPSA